MRVWRVVRPRRMRTSHMASLVSLARSTNTATTHSPPTLPCLETLPLELVLRRLQSSSLTNPARSLRAHFADLSLTTTDKNAHASSSSNALYALRNALSARLTAELTRDATQAHLGLDEVSLMLANALRHGLQATLQAQLLHRFIDLSERTSATAGRLLTGMGGLMMYKANDNDSVSSTSDGLYGCATPDLEALVRVLEACVDVAELHLRHHEKYKRSATGIVWGVTEWAALFALLETRWAVLMQSRSTIAVTLQCLSLIVSEANYVTRSEEQGMLQQQRSSASASASESLATRWRRGFLHMQTDPALLMQRARRHCVEAMHALLSLQGNDDHDEWALCDRSAEELVRLCHAVGRLRRAETAALVAQDAQPVTRNSVRTGLGLRHRARTSLRWSVSASHTQDPKCDEAEGDLFSQFALAVSEAVVRQHTARPSSIKCHEASNTASSLTSRTHAVHPSLYTLPQLAAVFGTLCTLYDTQGALPTSLSVVMCNTLHSQCGAVDTETIDAVLQIGECCVEYSTGGVQAILCEVLRNLRAMPHALLHQLCTTHTPQNDGAHTESNIVREACNGKSQSLLWVRACELLDRVPYNARHEARATLLRFVQAVGQVDVSALTTTMSPSHVVQLRQGMLQLARLLLREEKGYISQRFRSALLYVVKAATFHDDPATGLTTCVQALYVYTTLVQREHRMQQPDNVKACGSREELRIITYLLQELAILTTTETDGEGTDNSIAHLPPSHRADLREAMRTVGALTKCNALSQDTLNTTRDT